MPMPSRNARSHETAVDFFNPLLLTHLHDHVDRKGDHAGDEEDAENQEAHGSWVGFGVGGVGEGAEAGSEDGDHDTNAESNRDENPDNEVPNRERCPDEEVGFGPRSAAVRADFLDVGVKRTVGNLAVFWTIA